MYTQSRLHLLTLLTIMLCGCLVLSARPMQAGELPQPSPGGYIIVPTPLGAGAYRLTGTTWRVTGASGGGAYQLASVAAPQLTGNGCCCVHLPCIQKK